MLKIALQGMKGRKKDSLLLCTILILSILFVMSTITIFSSAQYTKQDERLKTFGSWRSLSAHKTQSHENSEPSILTLGSHELLGAVGTASESFMSENNTLLKEGRWPATEDEIVLEHSALASLSNTFKVGDTIELPIDIVLMETAEDKVNSMKFQNFKNQQLPIIHEFIKNNPQSNLGTFVNQYENIYYHEELIPHVASLMENDQNAFLSTYNLALKKRLAEENLDRAIFEAFSHSRTLRILTAIETPDFIMETKRYSAYNLASTSNLRYWSEFTIPDFSSPKLKIDESYIIKNGVPLKDFISIKKAYKVVGILNNYTSTWTTDDAVLPNVIISPLMVPKILESFYKNPDVHTDDFRFEELLFHNDLTGTIANRGAYPNLTGNNEKVLMYGILGLIFVATTASVFQIYLTQMKRRKRRLVLLRSIGATKMQLIRLLLSEMIIVMLLCFPISIIIGLIISYLNILGLNWLTNSQLIFALNIPLLIIGSLLSLVSMVLGTCLPMLSAQKTPLVGTISIVTKKGIRHKSPLKVKMDFKAISMMRFKRDSKKNLVTLALYSVAITTLIGTFIGSFISFVPYIDRVVLTSKPDYSMDLDYGLSFSQMSKVGKILSENDNIKGYDFIKEGENAYFYHEALKFNPPFTQWTPIQVYRQFSNIGADKDYLIRKSMPVTLYGIDLESSWFKKLMDSGAMTTLDVEAFKEGRETIVLLPKYSGSEKSFSVKKNSVYSADYAIKVGDTFNLSIATEDQSEGRFPMFKNDARIHEVKVGAIVNTFAEEGLWPIADAPESPIIITSYQAMNVFFPNNAFKPKMDRPTLAKYISTQRPTSMGKSHLYVYTKENPDYGAMEITMRKLSSWLDSTYNELYIDKYNRYNHSLRLSMLVILLGFSVSLVTLLILYNNNHSKVEHEREHIGVLQALGVTKRSFKWFYFFIGLCFSFLSLIVAFIVNGIILNFAFSDLSIASWNFNEVLWAFPIKLLGTCSLVFMLLATLVYYLPLKKILRFRPIENINALQK